MPQCSSSSSDCHVAVRSNAGGGALYTEDRECDNACLTRGQLMLPRGHRTATWQPAALIYGAAVVLIWVQRMRRAV
jgi:hypothetical protein